MKKYDNILQQKVENGKTYQVIQQGKDKFFQVYDNEEGEMIQKTIIDLDNKNIIKKIMN